MEQFGGNKFAEREYFFLVLYCEVCVYAFSQTVEFFFYECVCPFLGLCRRKQFVYYAPVFLPQRFCLLRRCRHVSRVTVVRYFHQGVGRSGHGRKYHYLFLSVVYYFRYRCHSGGRAYRRASELINFHVYLKFSSFCYKNRSSGIFLKNNSIFEQR